MANFLKSLFIKGVEIDTTGASNGNVLSYNGTKFAPAAPGSGSLALDDLSDVVVTSPEEFQGLSYNGTSWVNSHIPLVSYVRNAESTTITTGTVVYLFGATGDHATVKRADKSSDTTSSKTIGVAGANITASNNGPIVTRGYVDGIDLSVGYTAGDVLWLGDDGAFTTTKATAPDHLVFVGVVVRATNNGIIYVATQNGYELDELHNVSLPSPQSGEFLKYNGSLWVADAIDLGTDTTGNYMSGISGTSPVSVSHTPSEGSSATVSLASGYGDTQNPYDSKTANYFLASPNGSAGAPTFRAIVAADIPTLNQNTTGTASNITESSNTTLTSLSNLTTIGTLVSGSIPATLLTGTIASARLSGSYTGITSLGTLTGLAVAGNIAAANTGGQDAIQISPRFGGTNYRVLQLTTAALTASTRVITLPDTNGTVITTGNLSSITAVGTLTGLTSTGTVTINNGSPTIAFQDTDNRSAFIHVNSNLFYVLRGEGTNSTTWSAYGGYWPLIINLENNDATFGGTVSAVGSLVAGSKLRAGNVSYQTYDAYAGILFHESYSGAQYQVRVGEFYSESAVGSINGYSFTIYAGNELHLRSRYGATNVISLSSSEWCYIRLYPTTSASTVRDAGFGLIGYFSSRAEIKENVESVSNEDALNRVLNMRPVEFNFKQSAIGDGDNPMVPLDRKRGFIADEMAALDHKLGSWGWVNPDNSLRQVELNSDKSVSLEDAVPIYWDHDAVIADLVASIQSLNARLVVLESN